jgi:hypothetical protein
MLRNALFTLLLAIFSAPLTLSADTLLIDGIEMSGDSDEPRPTRGMTMDEVSETFGVPAIKERPVGDPPIARWEYPGFVVYFEYSTVIHTVMLQPAS